MQFACIFVANFHCIKYDLSIYINELTSEGNPIAQEEWVRSVAFGKRRRKVAVPFFRSLAQIFL